MVDVRTAQRVSAPEPLLPAHLATKSYVDNLVSAQVRDSAYYGDVLSSARREHAINQLNLDNGFWAFSSVIAASSFTATKIRFYIVTAGVAATNSTVAALLYDNGAQAAAAPVTTATFTATGIKELTLSAQVNVVTGRRYTWLAYIAPNSYTTPAGIAATAAYYSGLANPTAALTFNGHKPAATAPPAAIDTGDGTWIAHAATTWWALL